MQQPVQATAKSQENDPQQRLMDSAAEVIATRLKQVSIKDPEDANQVFGRKERDGSTPIVITPRRASKANMFALVLGGLMAFTGLFLSQIPYVKEYLADPIIWSWFGAVTYWPIMVVLLLIGLYPLFAMKIPSGVFALMTRSGRYVGVYEAGRHMLPPWYKIAYMVTRQSTAYNAPVKNCPTADNVMVKVDLLLVFHVEDPEAFVYKLGAEKFGDLLSSSAEEAIRGLVRSTTHDKAYELRGQGAGEMSKRSTTNSPRLAWCSAPPRSPTWCCRRNWPGRWRIKRSSRARSGNRRSIKSTR